MYHFIEKMSFPPNILDSSILCGIEKHNNIMATNNPTLVSCPICITKMNKCRVCGCFVPNSEISANDFYIHCIDHKIQAQVLTEIFFKNNPDYTKW